MMFLSIKGTCLLCGMSIAFLSCPGRLSEGTCAGVLSRTEPSTLASWLLDREEAKGSLLVAMASNLIASCYYSLPVASLLLVAMHLFHVRSKEKQSLWAFWVGPMSPAST